MPFASLFERQLAFCLIIIVYLPSVARAGLTNVGPALFGKKFVGPIHRIKMKCQMTK